MAALTALASPLRILPLASTLNPPDQVRATIGAVSRQLDAHRVAHEMAAQDGPAPDALFIVTGGTEHLALVSLERTAGPVLLIAHPEQNSLPAALEILARARQLGRKGCICLLGEQAGGFDRLARLASHLAVRRRLMSSRVGRIGVPSDWLVASMPDAALVAEAWGPFVVDVPIAEVFEAMRHADSGETADIARDFVSSASAVCEPSPEDLERAARVTIALRDVTSRHRLDACSVRCFDLVTDARTTGCLALSWLLDHGTIAGCEGDMPATITMMWMDATSGGPTFLANPQGVDLGANTLSLAHCTIARGLAPEYTLRSHFESSLGVGIAGVIAPGDATVARVGGADLRALWVSDGQIVGGGDNPRRCRTQVQVRLSGDAGGLLTQPLGNHVVLARGRWAEALQEYHDLFVAH